MGSIYAQHRISVESLLEGLSKYVDALDTRIGTMQVKIDRMSHQVAQLEEVYIRQARENAQLQMQVSLLLEDVKLVLKGIRQ